MRTKRVFLLIFLVSKIRQLAESGVALRREAGTQAILLPRCGGPSGPQGDRDYIQPNLRAASWRGFCLCEAHCGSGLLCDWFSSESSVGWAPRPEFAREIISAGLLAGVLPGARVLGMSAAGAVAFWVTCSHFHA